jgi:hypothetical protein
MLNRYIKLINKKISQKYLDCFCQKDSKENNNISSMGVVIFGVLIVISVGVGVLIGVWLWPGLTSGGGGADDLKELKSLVDVVVREEAIRIKELTKLLGKLLPPRAFRAFDIADDRVITTSKIIEAQLRQNQLFEEAKLSFVKSKKIILFSFLCGTVVMVPAVLSFLAEACLVGA